MVSSSLDRKWLHLYCSSSVANFKEKLNKKLNLPEYNKEAINESVLFFGMYHKNDYKRFIKHKGKRIVYWCGSDILNLNWKNNWIFRLFKAEHICENKVEQNQLFKNGIVAEIKPLYLGKNFDISYKQSDKPHVWFCIHPKREVEYGLYIIYLVAERLSEIIFHIYGIEKPVGIFNWTDNVIFHSKIIEEQLDEDIKNYQAGIRLNEFDGFSEVISKSILLGQYPISRIKYDYVDSFSTIEDLLFLLHKLKYKYKPNVLARNYWMYEFNKWQLK